MWRLSDVPKPDCLQTTSMLLYRTGMYDAKALHPALIEAYPTTLENCMETSV